MKINNNPTNHRLEYLAAHRGRVVNISGEELALIINELQQYRKAAMQQEPVAWRYRYHNGLAPSIWKYADSEQECNAAPNYQRQPLYAAPPAPVVPDDYFASLVAAARVRADKAIRKFPQPNYVLNKVAEESGEVIKAVIHYTEGREEWANVEGELVDNLAMLIRLITEGDQVIGFTPPDACRAAMLNGGKL